MLDTLCVPKITKTNVSFFLPGDAFEIQSGEPLEKLNLVPEDGEDRVGYDLVVDHILPYPDHIHQEK